MQIGEMRDTAIVLRDDLSVEQGRVDLEDFEPGHDRRKALRPVEALARQQARVAAVDASLDAVAIKFELVDPMSIPGRFVGEQGKTGFNEVRQSVALSAGGHSSRALSRRLRPSFGWRHRPAERVATAANRNLQRNPSRELFAVPDRAHSSPNVDACARMFLLGNVGEWRWVGMRARLNEELPRPPQPSGH